MNLNEIRTYTEVLRRGSLTEAGRALGLTQSGVTRQIQRLEQDLGVPLLRRETTPITPTVAGERFATFAEDILREFDALKRELEAEAGHPTLDIAASTTPGEFLVPELMVEFAKSYPGWRHNVHIMDSAQVVEQVEAGAAQVGFVGSLSDHPALRFMPFVLDELVVVVRADHPLARLDTISLDCLAEYPVVLREAGSGTLRSLQTLLESEGRALPPLQVAGTFGSTQAVLSAIMAGAGFGFASARALAPYGAQRLKALRIAGLPLWRQLYLVVRNSEAQSPAIARFIKVSLSWAAYQTA